MDAAALDLKTQKYSKKYFGYLKSFKRIADNLSNSTAFFIFIFK